MAYAASTGAELSFEQPEWGHGAFTKGLIEALGEGKADLLHNGAITTSTLDAFVAERVKQLTGRPPARGDDQAQDGAGLPDRGGAVDLAALDW